MTNEETVTCHACNGSGKSLYIPNQTCMCCNGLCEITKVHAEILKSVSKELRRKLS